MGTIGAYLSCIQAVTTILGEAVEVKEVYAKGIGSRRCTGAVNLVIGGIFGGGTASEDGKGRKLWNQEGRAPGYF